MTFKIVCSLHLYLPACIRFCSFNKCSLHTCYVPAAPRGAWDTAEHKSKLSCPPGPCVLGALGGFNTVSLVLAYSGCM